VPTAKQFISGLVITVPAIVIAGLLMNALRDNDFIKSAISGFDS